jgi:hypothetical protein
MTANKGQIGSCRRDGCDNPRRVRRGRVEPLCEDCYWEARRRVADQLADEETAAERRKRYRRFQVNPGQQDSPQQARTAVTGKPGRKHGGEAENKRGRRGPARPRLISEELLAEVRRRHHQERQPLRRIAMELLAQTGYANARSAEMALRAQFKRRGWPLNTGRQGTAAAGSGSLGRAA